MGVIPHFLISTIYCVYEKENLETLLLKYLQFF